MEFAVVPPSLSDPPTERMCPISDAVVGASRAGMTTHREREDRIQSQRRIVPVVSLAPIRTHLPGRPHDGGIRLATVTDTRVGDKAGMADISIHRLS